MKYWLEKLVRVVENMIVIRIIVKDVRKYGVKYKFVYNIGYFYL